HFKMSLLELLVITEPDVRKAMCISTPNISANSTSTANLTLNIEPLITLGDSKYLSRYYTGSFR
ncbi:hypothetical protein, partial [Plesiomonas shigelloides]|uniref:hypothetical protein n=1 Tax=Plesiomonas shigelloides TaxID=703 RepID=UPI001C4987E2